MGRCPAQVAGDEVAARLKLIWPAKNRLAHYVRHVFEVAKITK